LLALASSFWWEQESPEFREFRGKCRNSCPTGIPAKKSYKIEEKKQEFLRPPPKPRSCEKIFRETQGKKKSSGILSGMVFRVQKINT